MLNVYEQIDRNRRRSFLVIAGFVLFVLTFVYLVGRVFGSDPSLVFAAAVFSLFSAFGGYFWGDKIILASVGGRPARKEEFFDFYTVVENLSIAAQIPMPSLYVIDSPSLNAFATGRDPNHAVICATTGLLEKLDRSELEGVIGHEISHIKNLDIRLMTIVAVLVGMVTLLSDWILRGYGRKEKEERSGLVYFLGFLAVILAPFVARLIQLAISRRREFLADAFSAKLTRYPQGLIRALKKIASESRLNVSPAVSHLFISSPLKGKVACLFSTHPPIEERIKALEEMV